ncbi:MAG: His-Xaa-Ser system radical SAM maturase HxsB [Muribaculaceae bacterium]|nr:His-Xaa-Ser system radical SAM maturase HxsB [Muribaculaceae bacterium]
MMSRTDRNYHLLPFNFVRLCGREVLVNELGDMIVAPAGTVERIVERRMEDDGLYKSLMSNFFISREAIPPLSGLYAARLHERKSFIDAGPALHIFVLTLRCNQNCRYCHASSRVIDSPDCTMSVTVLDQAVALMMQSPSREITMEFQGGEPSLLPELIRHAILRADELNRRACKTIHYVLCTNCVNLSPGLLELCAEYGVVISTSLDGPWWLHNANRGTCDSHARVVAGIEKARAAVGHDKVSALMTASRLSLDYPREIVDEYLCRGFNSIFLRALNPYGLAADNADWADYTDRFVEFYKQALEYIIELNRRGIFIVEEFASIVLKKILTPGGSGFVDLQSPSGIINSVLAYNYDGGVYCSDESRMLAERGDDYFRLGCTADGYESIVYGPRAKKIAQTWAAEALAGCSDCALRPYCGADPVRAYSTQGNAYGHRPTSLQCRKHKAIIEHLISLIIERADEVLPIFSSWTA